MASLQELLAEDGFIRRKYSKPARPKDRITVDDSIALPIYICHDRKSIDFPKQKLDKSLTGNGSLLSYSKKTDSNSKDSKRSSNRLRVSEEIRRDEPAIDEVAVRAVISILSGYVGRFFKDQSFRNQIYEKCSSYLERKKSLEENTILVNMELGIQSINRLADDPGTTKESKMRSLRNSIRLLSIVASLNSPEVKNGVTCGIPNSHLSACAQLYLSIVYKIEKNDRISARHLLQVFCDSPYLARRHLLPDLWEHFFLPHLLHLKVWYSKEVKYVSNSEIGAREKRMKVLKRVYNDQMDMGTAQFALYYKEWLKVGVKAPAVPSVSLPSRPSYQFLRKKMASANLHSSSNRSLYRAVFGPSYERKSMDCEQSHEDFLSEDDGDELLTDRDEGMETEEDNCKIGNSVHGETEGYGRSPNQIYNPKSESESERNKSDYFRFFSCRSEPATGVARHSHIPKREVIARDPNTQSPLITLSKAITVICTSGDLSNCEIAIRVVAKSWLDSHGDSTVEAALSKAPVIEGILEVAFSSEDDEILELSISILSELVARNEVNRQIVLNADPQLEISMRLLRSNSLFLKAAVLLYLLKPKAKQMVSLDWVPLVLRVLEFGDQLQTLFTIQCRTHTAVFYFLDQLLTGFDVDRNVENAKQVVSLGGLRLLIKRLEIGDSHERKSAASLLSSCIQADGSCRHYLANNIKKASILELLIGDQKKSGGCAISLLTELVCLHRRTQIIKFLSGLRNEGCLNAMHILLVYLQRAPLEQRPLVAVILLQLDLLGDPSQGSVYREEVMDAITAALDCSPRNTKIQEQSGRALLLLGGHFSSAGKASTEAWLLKQAGFDEGSADSFSGKEIVFHEIAKSDEEEKAIEEWLRKAATILLTSGNKRFLAALSKSITDGIPCLARACLVTVAWMSSSLVLIQNADLESMACSVLVPCLLENLNLDRAIEDRVLASLSLLSFAKNSECLSMLSPLDERLVGLLRDLSQVTWTAKELLSIVVTSDSP